MISYTKLPCNLCKKKSTPEGHDPCLGTLEGVMNACCGHGDDKVAYIQYPDGTGLWSNDAMDEFKRLKVGRLFFIPDVQRRFEMTRSTIDFLRQIEELETWLSKNKFQKKFSRSDSSPYWFRFFRTGNAYGFNVQAFTFGGTIYTQIRVEGGKIICENECLTSGKAIMSVKSFIKAIHLIKKGLQ